MDSSDGCFPKSPRNRRGLLFVCICFNVALLVYMALWSYQTDITAQSSIATKSSRVPGVQEVIKGPKDFSFAPPVKETTFEGDPYDDNTSVLDASGSEKDKETTNVESESDEVDFAVGEKVAVVIETSMTTNLIPVMLHFLSVLGPSWKMILFTMESSWRQPASIPFRRAIDQGRISIRYLPSEISFSSRDAVSEFLAQSWLWTQLQAAYRVLLFQTDSILCANADASIDQFLPWDFIGAPVKADFGQGYNGGLSLRNPKSMLRITTNKTFSYHEEAQQGKAAFEDQWFYSKLVEMGDALLPGQHLASQFAVETIYYDRPLGFHQPQRWQADKMNEISKYCPETALLIGQRF